MLPVTPIGIKAQGLRIRGREVEVEVAVTVLHRLGPPVTTFYLASHQWVTSTPAADRKGRQHRSGSWIRTNILRYQKPPGCRYPIPD